MMTVLMGGYDAYVSSVLDGSKNTGGTKSNSSQAKLLGSGWLAFNNHSVSHILHQTLWIAAALFFVAF